MCLADSPTFLVAAKAELETIACELDAVVAESIQPSKQIPRLVEVFVVTINDFLETAQRALAAPSTQEHERRCMEALTPMRRIGDQADGLKFMLQPKERQALRVVMRALIEGPYLLVTDLSTVPSDWMSAAHQVTKALHELKSQVCAAREDAGLASALGSECT